MINENNLILEEAKGIVKNSYSGLSLNGDSSYWIGHLDDLTISIDQTITTHAEIKGRNIKLKSDKYTYDEKRLLVVHEILHYVFTHPLDCLNSLFVDDESLHYIKDDVKYCVYDVFIDYQIEQLLPNALKILAKLGKPTRSYKELDEINDVLIDFVKGHNIDKKIVDIYIFLKEFFESRKTDLLKKFSGKI